MEISVKSLWMGASVVITVALISLGLFQYSRAKQLSAVVSDNMRGLADEIEENEVLRYDGLVVSGSDVRNFAKRMFADKSSDGFTVTVNRNSVSKQYASYAETDYMSDPDSASFIPPTEKFRGKVQRNGNGIITGIVFTGQ